MPEPIIRLAQATVAGRCGAYVGPVDLSVHPGTWVTFFGPIAAGKTLLLRAIAGDVPTLGGSMSVRGAAPDPRSRHVARALEVAPASHTTVRRYVGAEASQGALPPRQRSAWVDAAVEVTGLALHIDDALASLSSGQRSCAALAGAIARRASVLLLDDLLPQLDPTVRTTIRAFLDEERARDGLVVIEATTCEPQACLADRVVLLREGSCLAVDTPSDLKRRFADDAITVEAADPGAVQRTARGIFDVRVEATDEGMTIRANESMHAAAALFRHPQGGVRTVYVRPPTLWDVIAKLSPERTPPLP